MYFFFSYVWYVLIPFLVVERLSMSAGFMAVNILLNNAADAKYMGLVNGLGMTASCVFRLVEFLFCFIVFWVLIFSREK